MTKYRLEYVPPGIMEPVLDADTQKTKRRVPGARTISGLARAAIPARTYLILAVLAVFAAAGMTVTAYLLRGVGPPWLASEAASFASTFRAMPLWFLIGGVMSQLSSRIGVAFDDLRAWMKDGDAA